MGLILRLITAAGLAVDAAVHVKFAPEMANVPGGGIPGDTLFYVQAAVAGVAALLVLLRANRLTYAVAFLVAASAFGAVLLYYYVDVGSLGPIPEMHEPVWYLEKTVSAVGEGVAALTALIGFATVRPRPRSDRTHLPSRDLSRQY